MNLSKSLLVFLLFAGAVAARAQLGVYGTYTADHLGGVQCLSTVNVPCSNGSASGTLNTSGVQGPGQTGGVNPSGFWGGIYYDFRNVGPVRLGIDLRGGEGHSNKSASSSAGGKDTTEAYSFMGGVRGAFRTPYPWLKPYGEIAVGYTRSNVTEPFGASSTSCSAGYDCPRQFDDFLRYEGFVGVDLRLTSVLDLRPVELGLGDMQRIGTGTGSNSASIRSIGAGVVLHLPSFQ